MDVAEGLVLLENAVRFRAMALESELDIYERQIEIVEVAPGLEKDVRLKCIL